MRAHQPFCWCNYKYNQFKTKVRILFKIAVKIYKLHESCHTSWQDAKWTGEILKIIIVVNVVSKTVFRIFTTNSKQNANCAISKDYTLTRLWIYTATMKMQQWICISKLILYLIQIIFKVQNLLEYTLSI